MKLAKHEPHRKKCIQSLKAATRDLVHRHLLSKVRGFDVVLHALARKVAPEFAMSPLPFRRKMKAIRPPLQPKPISCVKQVPLYNSHSEAQLRTNEQTLDASNATTSTNKVEFHVMSHVHVL